MKGPSVRDALLSSPTTSETSRAARGYFAHGGQKKVILASGFVGFFLTLIVVVKD